MAARLPILEAAPDPGEEQVPLDAMIAAIADRLAARRQGLAAMNPGALWLAAERLATRYLTLRGQLARVAPLIGRTPRYLNGQLLGEHGLPAEDLWVVEGEYPAAPEPRLGSLAERAARATREAADLRDEVLTAVRTGDLTLAEATAFRGVVDAWGRCGREIRVALIEVGP
jgi:hypothetical protein